MNYARFYAENTRDNVHVGIRFFILSFLLLMVSLSEDNVHYFPLKFHKTLHTQIQQHFTHSDSIKLENF